MLCDSIQQDRPAFRAVVTHKDIGEQNNGEGLGGITQAVYSLINKSSQNPQFVAKTVVDYVMKFKEAPAAPEPAAAVEA